MLVHCVFQFQLRLDVRNLKMSWLISYFLYYHVLFLLAEYFLITKNQEI